MRTIQEVGSEILNGHPGSFYLFAGEEWGVKNKYLEILKTVYEGRCFESSSIDAVLRSMRKKQLIPLQPALYIIRHDEEFISNLSASTEGYIKSTKICGTIVGLYESAKHTAKLEKYVPQYTVYIDKVDKKFIKRYLIKDFDSLPEDIINIVADVTDTYGQAQLMCTSLTHLDKSFVSSLSEDDIRYMFRKNKECTENQIKIGIAARNFNYLMSVLKEYDGDWGALMYTILSTLIEIDKLMSNPRSDSILKDYVKSWTREDLYYMFVHVYEEIKLSRTNKALPLQERFLYSVALSTFDKIPSPGDMSND